MYKAMLPQRKKAGLGLPQPSWAGTKWSTEKQVIPQPKFTLAPVKTD